MSQLTIIIPVLNRVNLLLESLKSLINQLFSDFEVLIIDDGSDEETISQVERYIKNKPHIRIIKNDSNSTGASACRNRGIKESSSELIIYLDSDDLLAPDCLQQRVKIMNENPDLDFAVFPMLIFNKTPGDTNLLWNRKTTEPDLNRFLRLDSVWQTSGPIWRKSALERIGGFDETLSCWQDVDIHLKALFSGLKYKVFEELLPDAYYRKHQEGSISQNSLNSKKKIESRLKLFSWAIQKLKETKADPDAYNSIKEMLLGILISMGTTLQIKWLVKSLKLPHIKTLLTNDEKRLVLGHAFFYKTRLYKFRALLKPHLERLNKHFSPKHVGKFTC